MSHWTCTVCQLPIPGHDGLVELSWTTKKMRVVHHACTNDENGYGYFFHIPGSLETWCGWLFHLEQKNWFDEAMARQFLMLWWSGQNLPHPQPL